jgi:pimeloyl-ACP methyl ester carboxylesterase
MPSLVHSDHGQGPVVVLVHGVGVGPGSFAAVANELATDHRVVVVGRPTGEGSTALALGDQADGLVAQLDALDIGRCRLVGVSGGATLGLEAAMRHHGRFDGLVLHEPLVGRHVPELHQRFDAAARRAAQGPAEAMDVVRAVMGDATWEAMGPEARSASIAQGARWQGEVRAFARFDPTAADLASLHPTPLLVTVGGRSDPIRHLAADVLVALAGATVEVVPGAGNVAQVDAPLAFARTVRAWRPVPTGGEP